MGLEVLFQGRLIVKRQESDVIRPVNRGYDGGVVGSGYGERSPSMKAPAEGNNLFAAVVEAGQLQGILIGLRPGITEEELIVGPAGYFTQLVGEFHLQRDMDGIGIKTDFIQLFGDTLHIMRMGMTDRNNGMAAVQIQILLSLLVPYIRAFCFCDGDVVDGIDVK